MKGSSHAANKEALFGKGSAGALPRATFTTSSAARASPSGGDQPRRMNFEKLKEAEEWRTKATKALKTSVFGNWKPDHMAAGPYFDKAASLFKAAGAEEQAKDAYVRAAESHDKVSLYAAAATSYKNAVQLIKDSDEEEAAKLAAKEAEMWAMGGDLGRSADCYVKAATIIQDVSGKMAVDYAMQAVELLAPDVGDPIELSKAPLATDCFQKALNMCVVNESIPEALRVCDKASRCLAGQGMHTSLYKMFITQVILSLYQGDVVAAEKLFLEVHIQNSGYIRSNECEVEEALVHAAKSMSAEALDEAIKKLPRAYLDNNIVKLAKRLTVDRISGMGDFEDSTSPRSPTPPPRAASPLGGSFARRPPPPPAKPTAEIEVDPEMELSEEEKARIRAHPFGKGVSSGASGVRSPVSAPPAPAPAPAKPPKVPDPEVEASPMGQSGLLDISDLQASIEPGNEEDEDLDAMIAAARAASMGGAGDIGDLGPASEAAAAPAPAQEEEEDDDEIDIR